MNKAAKKHECQQVSRYLSSSAGQINTRQQRTFEHSSRRSFPSLLSMSRRNLITACRHITASSLFSTLSRSTCIWSKASLKTSISASRCWIEPYKESTGGCVDEQSNPENCTVPSAIGDPSDVFSARTRAESSGKMGLICLVERLRRDSRFSVSSSWLDWSATRVKQAKSLAALHGYKWKNKFETGITLHAIFIQ